MAIAGVASVVVASCGGQSENHSGDGAASGADGAASGAGASPAGGRSGSPGISGAAGRATTAGEGGTGGARGGTGGTVGGDGATSGAGTGGALPNPGSLHACSNPSKWSANLELCDHGFVHRSSDAACPLPPHSGDGGAAGVSGNPDHDRVDCLNDNDCGGVDEFCVIAVDEASGGVVTQCQAGCVTNDDCESGEVCSCNPTFTSAATREPLTLGVCTRAACHTDADCANGALCASELFRDIFWACAVGDQGVVEFQCQSESDECSGPEDCEPRNHTWEMMLCPYENDHHVCVVMYDLCSA